MLKIGNKFPITSHEVFIRANNCKIKQIKVNAETRFILQRSAVVLLNSLECHLLQVDGFFPSFFNFAKIFFAKGDFCQ